MKTIRPTRRSSSRTDIPRGFTLLELVLALGLASLLLGALYTALQMHWSAAAVGQVEMERSQVARALFRRIETDLRSVVFRSTALTSISDDGSTSSTSSGSTSSASGSSGTTSGSTSSSGTANSSSSTTSTSSSTTSSSTTTDSYSTQKTGIFGDSQSLIVHLSLPSRPTSLTASLSAAPSHSANGVTAYTNSDLQSVAYFLAGSSSTLAQQIFGGTSGAQAPATGLARLQGDRMAMQAADQAGDLSVLASGVQLLAPEVASIQFEYFDGVSWSTSWDSGVSNSIPNAVRITIEFLPPPATGGWYSRPVSQSTNRFQHTVALPLAEPYVPSDSL